MQGPSFNNLDESQIKNSINSINSSLDGLINSNISNNITQANTKIMEMNNLIQQLNQSANNISTDQTRRQLDELLMKFEQVKQTVESTTNSQISSIEQVVQQLGKMNTLMDNINDTSRNLKDSSNFDPQSANELLEILKNIRSEYDAMNRNSDFLEIKPENLEQTKHNVNEFFNYIADSIERYCNVGDAIANSCTDPTVINNMKSGMEQIIGIVNAIPNEFVEKTKQAIEDAQRQSQNFNNLNISNPTGSINYNNPVEAQQQINDINNSINEAMQRHFDNNLERILSAKANASDLQNNVNSISNNAVRADRQINSIDYNSYSNAEKRNLNDAGLNEQGIDNLKNSINNILRLSGAYDNKNVNIGNSLKNFQNAYSAFESDQSPENLKNAQKAGQEVERQFRTAASITTEILDAINKMSEINNLTVQQYDKLPDDVKKLVDIFKQIEESTKNSSENLLGIAEDFPMGVNDATSALSNGLKESNSQLSNMGNNLKNIGNSANGISNKLSSMFGNINRLLGNTSNVLNTLGFGVGLPMTAGQFGGYLGDVTKYYKLNGQMDVNSAMAQYAQGASGINESYQDLNQQIGREMYRNTYGMIGYEDYANMTNGLLANIQGHYGQGDNKAAGQSDMYAMSRTALDLNKLYGVDSQGAISAFYKELNMNAKETEELMLKLAGTAQSANIPVSEYTKTIAEMAVNFRNTGISIEAVESGMRNLTLSGMSMSNAQGIMTSYQNASTKMSDSWGSAGYFGMLSGAGNDPFSATWALQNKWDENGNIRTEATDAMAAALDAKVGLMRSAYGATGNSDVTNLGTARTLRQMGFDEKSSIILTNKYNEEGNSASFRELLGSAQENDKGQLVINQKDLEDKLGDAANYTDELTKAEKINESIKQELAKINEAALDKVGMSLQKAVEDLGSIMEKLSTTLNDAMNSGGLTGGVLNTMLDHPILTAIGFNLGSNLLMQGGNSLLGRLGTSLFGGGTTSGASSGIGSGISSLFSGGSNRIASSLGSKIPIIGGIIGGGLDIFNSSSQGYDPAYSAIHGVGAGGGTILGSILGSALGPLGTLAGGAAGNWLGGKFGGFMSEKVAGINADGSINPNSITGVIDKLFGTGTETNTKLEGLNNSQRQLLQESIDKNDLIYDQDKKQYVLNETNYNKMNDTQKKQLDALLEIKNKSGTYSQQMSGFTGPTGSTTNTTVGGASSLDAIRNQNATLGEGKLLGYRVDAFDTHMKADASLYQVDPNLIKAMLMGETQEEKEGAYYLKSNDSKVVNEMIDKMSKGISEELDKNQNNLRAALTAYGGDSAYATKITGFYNQLLNGEMDLNHRRAGQSSDTSDSGVSAMTSSSSSSLGSSSASLSLSGVTNNNLSAANVSKAPIYVMGSREYSNGTQTDDSSVYQSQDSDSPYMKNIQAMARAMTLSMDYKNDQYNTSLNASDDLATKYNTRKNVPDFNINITANDGKNGVDYVAMSKEIQSAVTNVVQNIMGSNTKIAVSNYQREMSKY